MSLNGLDAPSVSDAYYAAIVEVGGWFLLKYTSRDSVELLARGKGGVHEARNELLKYEDKSPLYGLIIYRRRKVLIKYIPNGTSRLLQARTAVHFQAVAERYAPYETILEISHPDELSDTSLASSFPLHTASPALSTTRLDEISEDAEDGGAGASAQRPAPARSNSAKFGTARYKTERRVDQLMRAQQRPSSPLRGETAPALSSSPTGGMKPSISQFLVREDSGTRSITSLTPSAASVTEYAGSIAESDASTTKETETTPSAIELPKVDIPIAEREDGLTPIQPTVSISTPSIREPSPERASEATERPLSNVAPDRSSYVSDVSEQHSISERAKPDVEEPFDFSYLEPKPKIKLGPRPITAAEKPRRSGNMGTSLLPSGYLAKKQEQQRPKSSGPTNFTMAGMASLPTPPPIPDVPEYNPRPVSRGSVKSMPSQKSTTMTPEKLRLMKAVELRKKQMRKSNPQIRTPVSLDQAPEVPKLAQNKISEQVIQHVPQPDSNLAESHKPDSAIAMEHRREEENDTDKSADPLSQHLVDQQAALDKSAGFLTKVPTNASLPSQQVISTPSEDALIRPTAEVTDLQQHAGAEPLNQEFHEPATLPSTSQIFTGEVQGSQIAIPLRAAPVQSVEDASGTATAIDQTINESGFSTDMENLITEVPAIVTTASSRPQTAEDPATMPKHGSPSPLESREPSSMESSGTLATPSDETMKQMSDLAKRRRGLVEPLHIDVDTRRNSVAESLSDQDFLEELQSATFHDAKEMSVSKSPGPSTPFFPPHLGRNSSNDSAGSHSRSPVKALSISNGMSQIDVSPDQQLQQRAETVSPDLVQQPQSGKSSHNASPIDRTSPAASLKRNVSSGITKRIQALNDLSNREPSAVQVHIPTRAITPDPAPVFLSNDRRPSMRSPHSRTGSSYRLRPHAERAGSLPNAVSQGEQPVWSTSQDTTSNRDSVSVKARIVRPPTSDSVERSADGANDLHESQIEINHSRGMSTPTSVSQAFLPPMPAPPANPPSPDHRSLHSLRRKSFGRTKASTPGPTPANDDVRSGAASITSADDQGGSRTSRFFKRMSNFGSTSSKRRSVIGPAVQSPAPAEPSAQRIGSVVNNTTGATATDRETPPAVQVGDLNVQFPDTLLWKRRWVSLDESGYLHLSLPTSQHNHSQSRPGKKFHISEFKAPHAPDLDQQELPHSICLEFTGAKSLDDAFGSEGVPGGVLQLACEDAMGQRHVLKLLGGYWKSWTA